MQLRPVREFQGLKLTTSVDLGSNISAIVGRNGSGKTRLLKAIADGHIEASVDTTVIPTNAIRLLTISELQPKLEFRFDRLNHRTEVAEAVAQYNACKGKFDIDPQRTMAAFSHQFSLRSSRVGIPQIAQIASHASQALGKDINGLSGEDIADFFSGAGFTPWGSLNVTRTVLAYWDRIEINDYNEFLNERRGMNIPHWTPDEFKARFGPPPWDMLNDVLSKTLDGRYHFEVPTQSNIENYEGRLYRSADGVVVDPAWLSSGEKVLMWLCLIMYATQSARETEPPPRIVLLDEPDSALHPQMVQKLHTVLRNIADTFGTNIIFTTHSPTSVALFDAGQIWQVSEHTLLEIDKDTAISELLIGLDQVHIHYTKCRQVYVESHIDEDIYQRLFLALRRWGKGISEHTALSFIPAAPKFASENIREIVTKTLGVIDSNRTGALINALNGLGNDVQVIGAVEALNAQNGVPVRGIIDWDTKNRPSSHIYVHGENLFYSMENAILNPLTLGFYLLHNFSSKVEPSSYGLNNGFDLITLYDDVKCWQSIVDGVTRRVLKESDVKHDIECNFLAGGKVYFDKRYAHMNGHELEDRLKQNDVYPFFKKFGKNTTLMQDVIEKGIKTSKGRTMPMSFVELFNTIQAGV
jgi:energy-coupling factor transporter ATP-binding protein EcfA2